MTLYVLVIKIETLPHIHNFQKLKWSKCYYYFLTNPELDSSYERIDLDDRLTPVSDDLKFYYGQTGLTGFADPDDVSGSGQDCSAKIFNALKHCYRQPTIPTTVNYNNKGSYFFLKNGQIPASFCLFSSFSHFNFKNTSWKKHRWCAWDLNPQPQGGRRWWHHGAMTATLEMFIFCSFKWKYILTKVAPRFCKSGIAGTCDKKSGVYLQQSNFIS